MIGSIDTTLTITGGFLYDWAIYQSLIGYDHILTNSLINLEYQRKMINIFTSYFIEKYTIDTFENLKIITKSLLLSLIPLHKNNKCIEYFNLLQSNYLN